MAPETPIVAGATTEAFFSSLPGVYISQSVGSNNIATAKTCNHKMLLVRS